MSRRKIIFGAAFLLLILTGGTFMFSPGFSKRLPPASFYRTKDGVIAHARASGPGNNIFTRIIGTSIGMKTFTFTNDHWIETPDLAVAAGWNAHSGFEIKAKVPEAPWKMQLITSIQREIGIGSFRFSMPARSNIWTSDRLPPLSEVKILNGEFSGGPPM